MAHSLSELALTRQPAQSGMLKTKASVSSAVLQVDTDARNRNNGKIFVANIRREGVLEGKR